MGAHVVCGGLEGCVEAWRGVWRHGGGCVCLGGGCAEEEWGRWLRWMSLHCVRGHKEVEPWGGVVGGGCGGCVRMCGGRMEGYQTLAYLCRRLECTMTPLLDR